MVNGDRAEEAACSVCIPVEFDDKYPQNVLAVIIYNIISLLDFDEE